ncbi:MAG TPA: decaprenyl-phosphate phosphoribosyltransferase [Candidatus Saccharimonadales bacterium]|nr:decaprenyl-phosphate phosphoribosyltransferase [Candidatus Saccharimonadales bacterium]
MAKLYYLLVSARPRQWLKNLAVFAAIFFDGRLANREDFKTVTFVFIIFCLLSSAIYLINDVVDIAADQVHFSKKERPIAKGLISRNLAVFTSVLLLTAALLTALQISDLVFLSALVFVTVQLFYSFSLKQIILLDVLTIAATFMLRVFAGSFAINGPLSAWLILTVMMLSLFLAIGKRRSEVTLLSHRQAAVHRKILSHYPLNLLDGLVFMMATATLLTYSLFSFNTGKAISTNLVGSFLPTTLSNPRWLMITIPVVVYGIFRYLYLIFEEKEGESPEKVLLSDFPLFSSVLVYGLVSFTIIYIFNA